MRQCAYCGLAFEAIECPDCARDHEQGRGWHRGPWIGSKGRIRLTLDEIEGNSEEADGGQAFAVKDFRS